MYPFIKPSNELRKNYNSVAESRREEDLATAQRLLVAGRARLTGTVGYSVNEFHANMREAIDKGAASRE